ncbi:MAG: hypothetical protein ABH852_05560 [Methanobacteriota archaeon]
MRGQSSVEMLILMGAILIAVTTTLYIGIGSNESTAVMQAARDGTENATAAIDADYACSIDMEGLALNAGTVTIQVIVRNAPSENIIWDYFRDTIIKKNIREGALKYINNALFGSFPENAAPVKAAYDTYDVTVEVRKVTK